MMRNCLKQTNLDQFVVLLISKIQKFFCSNQTFDCSSRINKTERNFQIRENVFKKKDLAAVSNKSCYCWAGKKVDQDLHVKTA